MSHCSAPGCQNAIAPSRIWHPAAGVASGACDMHACPQRDGRCWCASLLSDEPLPVNDPVNHPSHYTRGGVEVIDAIEAWDLGFCLGNTVKYVARAGHKGDALEDLKKARWYLDREIARREGSKP